MKRFFTVLTLTAITFASFFFGPAARADSSPYLNDFLVLSNKRADLHLAVSSKGVGVAFNDWLRTAHPEAARQGHSQMATGSKKTVASSCCKTEASGEKCGQCSTCGSKTSCSSDSGTCCSA